MKMRTNESTHTFQSRASLALKRWSFRCWGNKMKTLPAILAVLMLVGCGAAKESSPRLVPPVNRFPVPVVTGEPSVVITNPLDGITSPIMAVWQDSPGYFADTNYPYLRMAVWADGRVVFARDPNVWNHDLLLGRLPEKALTGLKQDIHQTGIFDLKGHCYLVPDAAVDCVMLSFGGSRQMLYWDEVEHVAHGINSNPMPHHLTFKRAWWEVNRLALSVLPDQARKLDVRFRTPPKEWYLKSMIQSE